MRTPPPPILTPAVAPRQRSLRRRDFFAFLMGVSVTTPFAAWLLSPGPHRRPDHEAAAPQADPGTGPGTVSFEPPALVFVIPADPIDAYAFGRMLGEYLNHGSDEQLAPLAVVPVRCVAEDELPAPDVVEGQGPYGVRIVRQGAHTKPRARQLRFGHPEPRGAALLRALAEVDAEERIAQRIDAIATAVRQAILPGGQPGPEWPEAAPSSTAAPDPAAQGQTGAPARDDVVERAALALLLTALRDQGAERARAMHTLAEMVRARLVRGTVPGAEWAVNSGCGTRVEGRPYEDQPDRGIRCGMGRVPEQSRRFLYFYTMDRRDREERSP